LNVANTNFSGCGGCDGGGGSKVVAAAVRSNGTGGHIAAA